MSCLLAGWDCKQIELFSMSQLDCLKTNIGLKNNIIDCKPSAEMQANLGPHCGWRKMCVGFPFGNSHHREFLITPVNCLVLVLMIWCVHCLWQDMPMWWRGAVNTATCGWHKRILLICPEHVIEQALCWSRWQGYQVQGENMSKPEIC